MSTEYVVYGDGEGGLRTEILAGLPVLGFPDVQVATRRPNPLPTQFVRLFRSGGVASTLVTEDGIYTFEAYDDTEQGALDLLMAVRAIVLALHGTYFGAREFGGPANLPDPDTHQVRYTCTISVRTRPSTIVSAG